MKEVLAFLKENPVFYIATVEGDAPRVRPFGFVMEYEGKLCFCTNNQKKIYKQLCANPRLEISATNSALEWMRLSGNARFITTRESKQAALDAAPILGSMYSADDSIFEIFCIEEAEAIFCSMKGPAKTIKL